MSAEITQVPRYRRGVGVSPELFESLFDVRDERLWRHRDRDENMLAALKAGWSKKSIARELNVSLRTVQLGIRRAKTAESVESPEAREKALKRLIELAKENQPRSTIACLKLALRVERELNDYLGPRPTPGFATLAHGFSEFASLWKRARQLERAQASKRAQSLDQEPEAGLAISPRTAPNEQLGAKRTQRLRNENVPKCTPTYLAQSPAIA